MASKRYTFEVKKTSVVDRLLSQAIITFKLSMQTADNVYQHRTFKHTMWLDRRPLSGIGSAGQP